MEEDGARRPWAGGIALGLLLLALYALPLLAPPGARPLAQPGPDAGLLDRLFPGTPGWWVVARLVALAAGAGILAQRLAPLRAAPHVAPARLAARRGLHVVALASAVGLALVALAADRLPRAGQLAFALALAVPTLVLAFGERRGRSGSQRAGGARTAAALAGTVLAWVAWRLPVAWHSTLAADPVDTWLGLESLERAATDGRNLLATGYWPGVPGAYLFFQGLPLVAAGLVAPSLGLVQLGHVAALALAAWLVGVVAARWLEPAAAPVAVAVLLFSPFSLFVLLMTGSFSHGPLLAAAALVAFDAVARRRSSAGLVALSTLGGIGLWHPPFLPFGATLGAAALWVLRAPPRPPATAFATAALALFAGFWPGHPDRAAVGEAMRSYTHASGAWIPLERIVFGQDPVSGIHAQQAAGRPGPLDLALGAGLAPFAIPRTPSRLWGDALFDPLGGALAALGLALCLRAAARERAAALMLALLAASLAVGFTSSYDRVSLTRLSTLPVVVALLAAVGFCGLARALRGSAWTKAVAATLAIALGGSLLFDVVNRRILARSSMGIALGVLAADPPAGGAAFLDYAEDQMTWLHVSRIAREVLRRPYPVHPIRWLREDRAPEELLFFSPGLDLDAHVARRICRRWPSASLYTLFDPAGLSRVRVARPAGPGWIPDLPPDRVRMEDCGLP